MKRSIDDYVPADWARCDTCGLYDPSEIPPNSKLIEDMAKIGTEAFLDTISLDVGSLEKIAGVFEIGNGRFCNCKMPQSINRYLIYKDNKYIRVTSTT